jgi:hypothetical protein
LILGGVGSGYYAQLTALSHIMGLQAKGQHTLAAGTGTFGYEPNVDYFFGFPRAITTGGVAFDIPFLNIVASNDGDSNKKKQFNQQIGILASALEHAVPEQMFVNEQNPGEAISAVKALQKASAQGQRIYQITQANQASALPNIHHAQATMDEIRNALNAGKQVTTHTDAVSVPGWSGAGYIITDPATGDGAYKISGGGNGGWLLTAITIGMLIITIFSIPVTTLFLVVLTAVSIVLSFVTLLESIDCGYGGEVGIAFIAIIALISLIPKGDKAARLFRGVLSSWITKNGYASGLNAVCGVKL